LSVVATGPLTSDTLSQYIAHLIGKEYLYFFDAAAPIVSFDSIDMSKAFKAARYGKGTDDYINCPMDKGEYEAFWNELVNAELAEVKDLDKEVVFEGCMPVEALGARGKETLLYGPLKPVGLTDPRTDRRPYAVVQLRQENSEGTMFNLVGFQTSLKWEEQRRVFQLIPGLEEAEFVRFGVMHRNTYINSPTLLEPSFQSKKQSTLFFAGQITGVEGYVESAASGLMAGINAARLLKKTETLAFPRDTAHGSLAHYITEADPAHFQPMNITFGLFPPQAERIRDKKERYRMVAQKALESLEKFKREL